MVNYKLDVFVLSFIFFVPISQTMSVINRNGTGYFLTCIRLACARAIARIKWRRLIYAKLDGLDSNFGSVVSRMEKLV